MECCFGAKKKNRPPTKDYQPYESGDITVFKDRESNDIHANNIQI